MLKSFSSSTTKCSRLQKFTIAVKLQQYNNTHNPFGHNQSKNPQSNVVGVVTRQLVHLYFNPQTHGTYS